MRAIDGIHHISLITGDAPRNVDFYARVLGLRLVKRTVNQDDPSFYHLFYADERGSPGADITFFEYPGARPGRAGAGMISEIVHRVADERALDFWAQRLAGEDVAVNRAPGSLRFSDPEGMRHELAVVERPDEPLRALSSEVPPEHALQGFEAVRALVADPADSEALLDQTLGFSAQAPHDWEARGESRGGRIVLQESSERGVPGAGTVHHIAWSVLSDEQAQWRERVIDAGMHATPIVDRYYFESVYFREPGGIIFELATLDGAGYTVDEPARALGEKLSLPPRYEPLRERVEGILTPLPDIRRWRPAPAPGDALP
jgi:glyoxalase family protein